MEFKVGDTVKILKRRNDIEYYPEYLDAMMEYSNTLATIKSIAADNTVLLSNNYWWDVIALEKVNKDKYLHPTELKDGDFIKIWNDISEYICIFEEYKDDFIYIHISFNLNNKTFNIQDGCKWYFNPDTDKITYATKEEENLFNIALLKEDYVWNNIAKQLQKVSTITTNDSTGVVDIPKEYCVSSCVSTVNPCHIPSHPKYGVFVDVDKEELNLFPTKKHYQLNFNY